MTLINRAAWRRIKARLEPKPIIEGKLYAADIKSVSIGGREFPGLAAPEADRSITFFKTRSCGVTTGLLEQIAQQYDVTPRREGETDEEFRARLKALLARRERALAQGWAGSTIEELRAFELRREFPNLFT